MLSLDAPAAVAPTLVLAVGNPSRGDDALGPRAAERIAALRLDGVEVLTDFQLQVEHALDLLGRARVLFVDASAALAAPYSLLPVAAAPHPSYTSHALAPAAVLHGYAQLIGTPPPAWVLAIRGEAFELGAAPGPRALAALEAALAAVEPWLRRAPSGRTRETPAPAPVARAGLSLG